MSKYISIDKVVESVSITHKFNKAKLLFLNTSDIEAGKIINTNFLPISELKGQAKKTIRKDDILFSEIRPKNRRFAYVDFEDTEDYVVSTKLMVLRNINPEVDNKYFYYFLTNDSMLNILQSRAENRICSFPQITFDLLSEYKIRIPDILEQKKLASVLSSLDSKIELNNRINRELEQMAKLLYDYWFVQFEFPFDFAQGKPDPKGKPYKTSGGKMVWNEKLKREIPEGWEVYSLSELLDCNKWNIKMEDNYKNINYLDTSSLTFNVIDKVQNMDFKNNEIPSRAQRVVSKNDILYSTVRPNQYHYGIIKEPLMNMIASTGFAQLRSKVDPVSNDLIYMFLTSETTTNRLQKIAESSVSAYPSVSPNDILGLKISLPAKTDGLKNINSLLDSINTKVSKNLRENQQLASLRDWLLPMLMNGQVTVGAKEKVNYEVTEGMDVAAEPGENV